MSQRVTCANCGFLNEPGDEFCGECGTYLAWSGTSDGDQVNAAASSGQAPASAAGLSTPAAAPVPHRRLGRHPLLQRHRHLRSPLRLHPQRRVCLPISRRCIRRRPASPLGRTRRAIRSCRRRRWVVSRAATAASSIHPAGHSASGAASASTPPWAPWPVRLVRRPDPRPRRPLRRPVAAASGSPSRASRLSSSRRWPARRSS